MQQEGELRERPDLGRDHPEGGAEVRALEEDVDPRRPTPGIEYAMSMWRRVSSVFCCSVERISYSRSRVSSGVRGSCARAPRAGRAGAPSASSRRSGGGPTHRESFISWTSPSIERGIIAQSLSAAGVGCFNLERGTGPRARTRFTRGCRSASSSGDLPFGRRRGALPALIANGSTTVSSPRPESARRRVPPGVEPVGARAERIVTACGRLRGNESENGASRPVAGRPDLEPAARASQPSQ